MPYYLPSDPYFLGLLLVAEVRRFGLTGNTTADKASGHSSGFKLVLDGDPATDFFAIGTASEDFQTAGEGLGT